MRRPMGLDRGVWASRLGWVDPLVSLVSLRTRVYHGSSVEMMADFGLFRETNYHLNLGGYVSVTPADFQLVSRGFLLVQ